ncbi:MAG: hypothetical protein DI586_08430 [Micavibrio aeruginosavorus]|uniref:Regulatory protein RecX n=1 Tax=Micavibrio aeruginosavorus TaxID=349221 RepID=A0A2W5FI25_9BACT|nr:MAG: hypothetical protein DI586_08430 [Micavibrio aeruginosavorus]
MDEEAISISDPSFKPSAKKRKIPKKITETYLINSGKFYLERFPASTEQFRQVMTRKIRKSCKEHPEQSPETCFTHLEAVITKFQTLGFLNDEGYAMGLSRSLKNRGWPRNRIIMRLREKGIAVELIDATVPPPEPGDNIKDAALWMKRKKLGAFATKEKAFEKALASLARAGFDYHSASKVLQMTKEEADELLNSASREY